MNFIKENKLIITITVFAFLVSIMFIFTNRLEEVFIFGKELMDFLYALSLSIIAAFIFYVFQVYMPNRKRRDIMKKHLSETYKSFKRKTIEDFLIYIDRQDKEVDDLLTFDGFKSFFDEKSNTHERQTNWHRILNEYEDNLSVFKELLFDLSRLEIEFSFILNNVEINDEELFKFIKLFKENIDNFKDLGDDKEKYEFYYKTFWRFLWSLYTGWDNINGQRETDIIEDMIKKI